MTRDERISTLILMGWVPVRGLMDHSLWHPDQKNIVRPIGGGAYAWSANMGAGEEFIEWDQWPDFYDGLEMEVIRGHSERTST